ncbi:MAG: translation initiation factor IF-2 [Alistipes sp.]|nr:translation initiation factor IF-2 [Alistipes sp.]MDY5198385.1 translation initiation factor IF-2 [Candidatus Cryptobacteroides sp.]
MAEIRLNKIIRTYNIGLQNLVDFLISKGVEVEANPNAKISDDLLPQIEKQFGKDLELKQASEKVDIKLNEILEKTSRKQQENAKEEEDEEPVRETVIKTTIFTPVEQRQEAAQAPQPEVAPEPNDDALPERETAPSPEPETRTAEEAPAKEAEPEVRQEPEPVKEVPAKMEEKAEAVTESKPLPETPKVDTVVKEDVPAPTTPAAGKDQHNGERPDVKHEKKHVPAQAKPKEEQQAKAKPQAQEEKPSDDDSTPGLKVLGKIDLSQFEPKKGGKKRERIAKGSQKVDVAKEGKQADNSSKKDKDKNKNAKQGQEQGKGNKKRNRGADRFKPAMTEEEQEAMQKEIQKQVKETYARMNDNKKNNFGAKYRKEKREQAAAKTQEEMAQEMAEKKVLKVTEFVTVNDLATLMNNTPVNEVIKACMELGLMVSINQRLDAEALVLVAEQFGYKVEFVTADLTEEIEGSSEQVDREEDLVPRPPIITVMGHVDHGKTSLLDYIRKSNVIAGEAGGITQHIGAYNVKLPDGRRITFLDTPGHEAFTAMRARGAQLTDLAIIIIAADDAVMPQTVEAINHAQAAGVPMVFAINKIDKPGAQPEKIYQQLAQMNILTEAWGGKYQSQEISAKKGLNVDKLLEKVLLETDLLDLKANPDKNAVGAVIESSLDKGRGYLATVLVQDGTLHTGDMMLSGCYYGRVKAMFNERGQKVKEAGPSTPVSVLGLNGAPSAGDKFNVMSDEKEAKAIANKREQLIRIQGIKTQKHMTLEEIGRRIAIGNFKELNVIVKGDVDGSVEALSDSLIKLSTEQVRVNVIHKAVGAISESDVILAEASDAVIIGFQVRPSTDARKIADEQGIEIRIYSVIYDAINDVKDGIEGMLEPIKKEEITGTAEVKQTFKISKVGTIAGCLVRDGKISKTAQCRLIRDGIVVYTGELASLKRGKDDVKEVSAGMECGIGIEKFNDLKVGDNIEAFVITEIKQKLD